MFSVRLIISSPLYWFVQSVENRFLHRLFRKAAILLWNNRHKQNAYSVYSPFFFKKIISPFFIFPTAQRSIIGFVLYMIFYFSVSLIFQNAGQPWNKGCRNRSCWNNSYVMEQKTYNGTKTKTTLFHS